MNKMITEIARSYIRIRLGNKTVTVEGEAYAPGYTSPNFVVYANSIRHWDPPNESVMIEPTEKAEILRLIKMGLEERKMTVEIE